VRQAARVSICGLFLLVELANPAVGAQQKFITVGTAAVSGLYYVVGGAVCRLMNKERKKTGIRCSSESTPGSVYNVNALESGDIDFGVVQSDIHYHAVKGDGTFKDAGPGKNLRSVFSVYPDALNLLARPELDVHSLEDLKGKRFNAGNKGSGQRASIEELLQKLGMTYSDFAAVTEFDGDDQARGLCENKFDGFFYDVAHPSAAIHDATTLCGSKLVPLSGPKVDELVKERPYYSHFTIPGGMYPNNPDPIETYGPRATLMTSSKTPEQTVYLLVKSVFENFDEFKKLHPIFKNLKKEDMVQVGLTAPLHPGAIKYFRESGLLPPETKPHHPAHVKG
jgi:TRAP transporter TAXI family solute receptor